MKSGVVFQNYIEPIFGLKTVRTAALAVAIEVRMSKKLASPKDAPLSKEMMKIVRMRLMGLKMASPPKVEVKPKVSDLSLGFFLCLPLFFWPTCPLPNHFLLV